MKITQKDVQSIADLAALELTDRERTRMEKDLNSILEYIDQLSELDTTAVEPMTQVSAQSIELLRDDELRPSLPRESAVANAPRSDGVFFRVPKVIER